MMMLILTITCFSVFAQHNESITELDTWGEKIIGLIKSGWVKALCGIALAICFGIIAFGNAQGEGGIIKKVLPWSIGAVGLMAISSILDFFWGT